MELKKIILATMGVAMSICAANAQQWNSNSYGLYNSPQSGNKSSVAIGTTANSTTSQYKLYVNGSTKLAGSLTTTGDFTSDGSFVTNGSFSGRGTGNFFENGLAIYATVNMSRTNLWIRKTDAQGLYGMRVSSCGYNNFTDLTIDGSEIYFNGAYGAKFMELKSQGAKLFTGLEVSGKIKCLNELEVADVLKANQIKAQDINVEMNNAADYVFDENYNLRSLSEVESFVKENKHLPGIPSASEMAENGMSMSHMSNLLLEKVEELTLHMIELEKENKELKNRVEMLEK